MRRSEGAFETADGLQLFEQSWRPDEPPCAAVVIVHGFAEHSGRYQHVAERLVGSGYSVYAFDLRGHGRSEGKRTYVRSVEEHTADLDAFLARVRQHETDVPLYLLGHSMGGTIVTLYLISGRREVNGAILSGAALRLPGGVSRVLQALLSLLGRLTPKLPLSKLSSSDVSRDQTVVTAYESDPLVYRGRALAGTTGALIRAIRTIEAQMEAVTLPLLLLHGTADGLTDPEGSRRLHERAASADKTLKLYEGLYHEVLNEPEKERVLTDIVQWLDERTLKR